MFSPGLLAGAVPVAWEPWPLPAAHTPRRGKWRPQAWAVEPAASWLPRARSHQLCRFGFQQGGPAGQRALHVGRPQRARGVRDHRWPLGAGGESTALMPVRPGWRTPGGCHRSAGSTDRMSRCWGRRHHLSPGLEDEQREGRSWVHRGASGQAVVPLGHPSGGKLGRVPRLSLLPPPPSFGAFAWRSLTGSHRAGAVVSWSASGAGGESSHACCPPGGTVYPDSGPASSSLASLFPWASLGEAWTPGVQPGWPWLWLLEPRDGQEAERGRGRCWPVPSWVSWVQRQCPPPPRAQHDGRHEAASRREGAPLPPWAFCRVGVL